MVNICLGDVGELLDNLKSRELVCYGAGLHFSKIMEQYAGACLDDIITCIVDRNEEIIGTKKEYEGKFFPVVSIDEVAGRGRSKQLVLLITLHWGIREVIEELDLREDFDSVDVYIGDFLKTPICKCSDFEMPGGKYQYIPKIIHYCWFGKAPIPEEYELYIDTWRRLNPDFEVKRWDESNYDVCKNRYMREAYENKKWAFVSDYARVDILHQFGGIYLDCDVELIKPLNRLLYNKFYCGFENQTQINLGLGFGSISGHSYLRALLDLYDTLSFVEDGKMNLVACPVYQTRVAQLFGIRTDNSYQELEEMTIFPSEVFSPISYYGMGEITERTYSIHHYRASWLEGDVGANWDRFKEIGAWIYKRYTLQEVEK